MQIHTLTCVTADLAIGAIERDHSFLIWKDRVKRRLV